MIIEGAHRNRGLGFEFLRHIERTKLLIFVLNASGIDGRDTSEDYQILRNELEAYNPELLERPSIVVLNKVDVPEAEEHVKEFKKRFPKVAKQVHEISAALGEGVPKLVDRIQAAFEA